MFSFTVMLGGIGKAGKSFLHSHENPLDVIKHSLHSPSRGPRWHFRKSDMHNIMCRSLNKYLSACSMICCCLLSPATHKATPLACVFSRHVASCILLLHFTEIFCAKSKSPLAFATINFQANTLAHWLCHSLLRSLHF